MATLESNILQAVQCFDDIKEAIASQGVPVPGKTPVNEYAGKIKQIERKNEITYEMFGAAGDGKTDDGAAVRAAHEAANASYADGIDTTVKGRSGAVYYIGNLPSTINVLTDADWNGCTFILDDYIDKNGNGINEVDTGVCIFTLASRYFALNMGAVSADKAIISKRAKNLSGIIDYLKNVTASDLKASGGLSTTDSHLDTVRQGLLSCDELLVCAENSEVKHFIRKGASQNAGTNQRDYFLIDRDGNVLSDIIWDFDKITKLVLYPVDKDALTIKNARFISYTDNHVITPEGVNTGYRRRGIVVKRANAVIDNIVHILDETKHETTSPAQQNKQGNMYLGFIGSDVGCSYLTIKDTKLTPHQSTNSSGTYDLCVNNVVKAHLKNVGYPHENMSGEEAYGEYMTGKRRWGIMASNYAKDVTIENCMLNRIDAHQGFWNVTVKNTAVGSHSIDLIGGGTFEADNLTLDGCPQMINLRYDYGSAWDGTITLKNVLYKLSGSSSIANLIYYENDGTWDFGYECRYPNIVIENLTIDDSAWAGAGGGNISLIPLYQAVGATRDYPYSFSDYIVIKNVNLVSGRRFSVFPSVSAINRDIYGNKTKTQIIINGAPLENNDVSMYNTDESQFNVINLNTESGGPEEPPIEPDDPETSVYGVEFDEDDENPAMERLYNSVGKVAYAGQSLLDNPRNDFDNAYPFSGITEETVLGRAMIKIPKFYVCRERYQKDDKWYRRVSISKNKYGENYAPHEMFLKGYTQYTGSNPESDYNDFTYVSKYEISGNDQSVSGAETTRNTGRENFRAFARAIGDGWSMMDAVTWNGLQTLFMIAFATRDSLSVMRGNYSANAKNTGLTDGKAASCTQVSYNAMNFYGIENLWNNIRTYLDGLNLQNRVPYVCTAINSYADATATGYRQVGFVCSDVNAYVVKLGFDPDNPFAELPVEAGGSASTYYCGGYSQYPSGWRIPAAGGYYANSLEGGIFEYNLAGVATSGNAFSGSRLIYRPVE